MNKFHIEHTCIIYNVHPCVETQPLWKAQCILIELYTAGDVTDDTMAVQVATASEGNVFIGPILSFCFIIFVVTSIAIAMWILLIADSVS